MPRTTERYSFEDFVTDTSAAQTNDALFSLLARAVEQYGYEKVILSIFSDPTLPQFTHHTGIFKRDLDDFQAFYAEKNHARIDPFARLIRAGAGSFVFADVDKLMRLSKAQEKFIGAFGELHIYQGVAVRLGHNNGAVGLSTANRLGKTDANLPVLDAICTQAFLSFRRINGTPAANMAVGPLTPAEREVLLWVAAGKTDDEIGTILSVSHSTVDTHLRSVFRKLQASNRVVAVLKAIQKCIISI